MTRTDKLNAALSNLQSSSSDIEASAVVTEDGLIIASSLPQGVEESRIAAMSAAMLSMGSRTNQELNRGQVKQMDVKGETGYVLIVSAGQHAVLLAMAKSEAKLGLIFLELGRTAEEIEKALS